MKNWKHWTIVAIIAFIGVIVGFTACDFGDDENGGRSGSTIMQMKNCTDITITVKEINWSGSETNAWTGPQIIDEGETKNFTLIGLANGYSGRPLVTVESELGSQIIGGGVTSNGTIEQGSTKTFYIHRTGTNDQSLLLAINE